MGDDVFPFQISPEKQIDQLQEILDDMERRLADQQYLADDIPTIEDRVTYNDLSERNVVPDLITHPYSHAWYQVMAFFCTNGRNKWKKPIPKGKIYATRWVRPGEEGGVNPQIRAAYLKEYGKDKVVEQVKKPEDYGQKFTCVKGYLDAHPIAEEFKGDVTTFKCQVVRDQKHGGEFHGSLEVDA